MQIYSVILISVCIGVLAGCAVKPINSLQTINGLQVSLNRQDSEQYTLVNQIGRVVSISNGREKVLNFLLPQYVKAEQCFSVLDKNRDNFLPDKPKFTFSLIQEYRNYLKQKQHTQNQIEANAKQAQIYRDAYFSTVSALNSNTAFINETCSIPPEASFSNKPRTECGTLQKCLDEGKRICSARFYLRKICTKALGLQTFSQPLCKLAEAKATDKNYEISDLLGDVSHGFGRDFQAAITGGLSFFYHTYNEVSNQDEIISPCVNDFVETKFNNPLREWELSVKSIKAEPREARNKCIFLEELREKNSEQADHYERLKELGVAELELINIGINSLANKKIETINCDKEGRISLPIQ